MLPVPILQMAVDGVRRGGGGKVQVTSAWYSVHLSSLRAPTVVCGALVARNRRSPQTTWDIATLAGKGKVQPVIDAFAWDFMIEAHNIMPILTRTHIIVYVST